MTRYTFGLAVKWEYDWDFIRQIEEVFQTAGYTSFIVAEYNVDEVTQKLKSGEIGFDYFLDRGSDEDEKFQDIADLLSNSDTIIINDYSMVEKAIDKSVMHKKLVQTGINLPHTVIVPPYENEPEYTLSESNSKKLGNPFVAKPAYYSGGSEGVLLNAASMDDVNKHRMILHDDNYLLQNLIIPDNYHGRRIWFRSFWFFSEAVPVWWDDRTHIYDIISREEFEELNLHRLIVLTEKIAALTGLHYFSCEATIDKNNELILIDYVNDQCDMRFKSKHTDGVPDNIVDFFIQKMLEFVGADQINMSSSTLSSRFK